MLMYSDRQYCRCFYLISHDSLIWVLMQKTLIDEINMHEYESMSFGLKDGSAKTLRYLDQPEHVDLLQSG